MLTERTFISQFTVLPTKQIQVQKTNEILRDEAVVSHTYQRAVLEPHDPQTEAVLGDEPFYLALATAAWKDVPVAEPEAAESE